MIFSNHEQREVASAIEQTQGGRDLTPGEAVQGQMSLSHKQKYGYFPRLRLDNNRNDTTFSSRKAGTHVILYGLRVIYTLHSLSDEGSLLLVTEGLEKRHTCPFRFGLWTQYGEGFSGRNAVNGLLDKHTAEGL